MYRPSSWRGLAQRVGPCSRSEASLHGKAMGADRRVVRLTGAFSSSSRLTRPARQAVGDRLSRARLVNASECRPESALVGSPTVAAPASWPGPVLRGAHTRHLYNFAGAVRSGGSR